MIITNNDAFFKSGSGGADGISDSVLDFTDFDFRSTTDLNDTDSASKLGKSFLELFLVVFRSGDWNQFLDLGDSVVDGAPIKYELS